MKFRLKINLLLIIFPFLISLFLLPFSTPSTAQATDNTYNQKIVAVVYDDSGSMSGDKLYYARYAMQVLIASLDYRDVLKVFPLNDSAFDVDLKNDDRNLIVSSCVNKLKASGGTPPEAITKAVNWLAGEHGLNKNSSVEGKEFKLIIITDGVFNGSSYTSDVVGSRISGYMGLQTSFFGIGLTDIRYRVDTLASQNSAVKAYYANNANQIVNEMQKITNSTTGRYKMEKGVTVDSNDGRVVYVDLNQYNFSIVSLGVLAQSENSSVKLKSIEAPTQLRKNRECNLQSSNVGLYGYSVMLSPINESAHAYLYKEKIKLVFETAPTDVLILLEPAISLSSSIEYHDGNNWVKITEQEINGKLKVGQNIRTRYHLVDANTNQDLTSVLNDVEVGVSYNGKIYNYNDSISLVEGKNEVALSVSINISGAKYTLFESWVCDVDVDPKQFRVETNVTENYDGDFNKVRVDYSVYYDYQLVTQNELTGSNRLFAWEIESIKDPDGNDVQFQSSVSGGTISVIFSKQTGKYGNYDANFKIVRNDNGKTRFSKITVTQSVTEITISKGNENDITLTTFELRKNDKPFTFNVTERGTPLNFNSGLIGYSFKIDGVDLTNMVTVENNNLVFVPNLDLPSSLQTVSEKEVVLEVWSLKNSNVKQKAISKLNILQSVYSIEVINEDNTAINIYDLDNCSSKIYYKITIDGNVLSSEDLVDGLNDGFIEVDTKPFGWVTLLPTSMNTEVVTYNGDAVICVSFGTTWSSTLANLFASFIFTGDKDISVTCGNGFANGVVTLTSVNFFTRLWRWIVIIVTIYLIVHIVLWIVGFFIAKRMPKGALIQIRLNPDKPKFLINVSSILVNNDKSSIIKWHLQRLIPFMEFKNQDAISGFGVTLEVIDGECVMVHNRKRSIIKLDLDDDDASNAIRKWKKSWQDYVNGTKPTLKLTVKQLIRLVDDVDKEVYSGSTTSISETYYATKNVKGKIDSIIFFKIID